MSGPDSASSKFSNRAIAPDIEDGAIVRHEIDTAAELCLEVGGTDPNGL
jgi:hypothetical protein